MPIVNLAEKLVSAENVSEIRSLLLANSQYANVRLAFALKDSCYASWTKEPHIAQKSAAALEILAKINNEAEISALAFWISGIARISQGKLKQAVERLLRANRTFLALGKEHLAAQTQVSKLIALALLGRYDEAVVCGIEAGKIFEKFGDELAAGKIEKNLGNIVSRQEKHLEAEKYYLSAHRRFTKLNDEGELTMCENGLAITYSALNDFRRAENFYSQALGRAAKLEMRLTEAEIEASMGNLSLFRAKFDVALRLLESSRQKYSLLKMPHQSSVAELEMADIYLELNLIEEAFEIYARLTEQFAELGMQGEEARARVSFARAAIGQGKIQLASRELMAAAKLFKAEKNRTGEAYVKLIETQLLFSQGEYRQAFSLAKKSSKLLQASGDVRYTLFSKWLKGEIALNLGKTEQAEVLFSETLAEAAKQKNLFLSQTSQTSLGKTALLNGNNQQAQKYFKKAIKSIENLRQPLPAEEFKMSFFADKLVSYQELAKLYLKNGKIKEAFLLVEDSRSRVLAESLDQQVNTSLNQSGISLELNEKLNDLREELNWLYNRLNRANANERVSLINESRIRENQISEVMRQINSIAGSALKRADRIDLKELKRSLGSGRLLLEYVAFDGNINVFIVSGRKLNFVENLATESEITELIEGLHFQFETMRYGTANLSSFTEQLKKRTDHYLNLLYKKLFLPIEHHFENRNLVIVPFGELHYIPFHALFTGTKYVIEDREISYAPSASVLQICLRIPNRSPETALLVGFADEKIPFVEHEIEGLKDLFPESLALTGEYATFDNFRKNAENFDILHLACHGQFRKDNPMFSSLRLADGSITVRDISGLKLRSDLVVLSACETGLNKVMAGDELLGLMRGFLSAGASSLMLTLWTVNDEAARELITDFYRELKSGNTPSQSLRLAQRNLIRQNLHPYLWSPFFLSGKG